MYLTHYFYALQARKQPKVVKTFERRVTWEHVSSEKFKTKSVHNLGVSHSKHTNASRPHQKNKIFYAFFCVYIPSVTELIIHLLQDALISSVKLLSKAVQLL